MSRSSSDTSDVTSLGRAARPLSLDEIVPLLASPDTGHPLALDPVQGLVAPGEVFPMVGGLAILLPRALHGFLVDGAPVIPPDRLPGNALLQYAALSFERQRLGPANTDHLDPNYLSHLTRARSLVREAHGSVLDVGCDSPELSCTIFPEHVGYIGLDTTFRDRREFRVIGMAEFLPFADRSVDNVALFSSLDHVLDHHRAIDEAWRVMRPGGRLYLSTLVWTHRAQLFTDEIHFHHFRDHEILGVLQRFTLGSLERYPWKNDDHRSSWYLSAVKGE